MGTDETYASLCQRFTAETEGIERRVVLRDIILSAGFHARHGAGGVDALETGGLQLLLESSYSQEVDGRTIKEIQ